MKISLLVVVLACATVHSVASTYHVLIADRGRDPSFNSDGDVLHSRLKRSLPDKESLTKSLLTIFEGGGSGNHITGPVRTTTFFLENTDDTESTQISLSDVIPGYAILTDFNIHSDGYTYSLFDAKHGDESFALRKFDDAISRGISSVMLNDVKAAEPSDSQAVGAVLNIAPSTFFAVSMSYSMPIESSSSLKQTYQTNVTINMPDDPDMVQTIIFSPEYPDSYPNNAELTWLIKMPHNGNAVNATILGFQTEACCDRLYMFDGSSVTDRLLLMTSGEGVYTPTISTGPDMLITFTSDCSNNNGGFSIQISSVAEAGKKPASLTFEITDDVGTISTPGYPSSYLASSSFIWNIKTLENSYITLRLVDIEIYDYETLTIYDPIASINLLPSGASNGYMIETIGNMATIQFVSGKKTARNLAGILITFASEPTAEPDIINIVQADSTWYSLTSPNFPSNYNSDSSLAWSIHSPEDTIIHLVVVTLDLEPVYDYLSIYDGNTNERLLVLLSGINGSDIEYITTYNKALVEFVSDYSQSERGFQLNFKTVSTNIDSECSGTRIVLNSDEGIVTTPNYPYSFDAYSPTFCEWLIEVAEGNVVDINIEDISVSHTYYRITFYDGDSTSAPVLLTTTYSVSSDMRLFTSTQNKVLVDITPLRDHDHIELFFTYKAVDYNDRFCAGLVEVNSSPIEITSPGYPRSYPPSSNCQWLVTSQTSDPIALVIRYLDLDGSNDVLAIYDGNSTSDTQLLYCQYTYDCDDSDVASSSGSQLLVTFNSSTGWSNSGFKLQETIVAGSELVQPIDENSGYALSPNYPNNYLDNTYETYTITVESGTIIYEFNYFYTESCCDYLYIYDGNSTSAQRLDSLSGSHTGHVGVASSNVMTMLFDTDGSVTSTGFQMYYTTSEISAPTGYTDTDMPYAYHAINNTIDYFYTFSPSYTTRYPDNYDFIWYFESSFEGYSISLFFYRVDIDQSDFVKVYSGFGIEDPYLVATVQGNSYLTTLYNYVYDTKATVWFHSDDKYAGKGFYIEYYI